MRKTCRFVPGKKEKSPGIPSLLSGGLVYRKSHARRPLEWGSEATPGGKGGRDTEEDASLCERLVMSEEVTRILDGITQGDPNAAAELLPLVYAELRRLAAAWLAREAPGQTLQPTALVHEAYLRLVGTADQRRWDNRSHFFGAAAQAMRRILVESARRKQSVKHGGARQRQDLEAFDVPVTQPPEELLALDEALTRLAADDAEAARIVDLHFFAGLSIDEAAEALGVSRTTAYRQWAYARVWLFSELQGGEEISPAP
jgi:RNA polymerase sigma factor (TIGR02999 family)